MPYGSNSSLIGSDIDPRLFIHDFSPIADAAKTEAQGFSNAISQVGDIFKEKKELEAKKKAGVAHIEYAMGLYPSYAKNLEAMKAKINDPDLSLRDSASIAEGVQNAINMSVGEGRHQEDMKMRQQQFGLDQARTYADINSTNLRNNMAQDEAGAIKRARDLDLKTKSTIGPALLESVLGMAPQNISQGVRSNIGQYTPDEQYSLAGSIMALIPKAERKKAPQVQDIPVAGGTQKMQWDEASGQWAPIEVAGSQPSGAVATMYGYPGDTTPDSNSAKGIGAFGKLQPNDFALSPDMEQQARSGGAKPGDVMHVTMENGDTVTGRWMDRTAQDEDVKSGRIKGVTQPLRGRVDFYSPTGVNPYDGMKVAGVSVAGKATPVGFTPTKPDYAAEDHAMKVSEKKTEKDSVAAAKSRMVETINRYITPDNRPTEALNDAVGFGERVGSVFGNIPFLPGGNIPKTMANQKELKLELIEQSILDAAKALKPVSNDEMKYLQANRPEITDHPEIWVQYMKKIKDIINDPNNFIGSPDTPEQIAAGKRADLEAEFEAQRSRKQNTQVSR